MITTLDDVCGEIYETVAVINAANAALPHGLVGDELVDTVRLMSVATKS